MRTLHELLNAQCIVFKHDHSRFVVVKIAIVWGRKYRDYSRKLVHTRPFVHFKSFILGLMRSDN